MTNSSATPTAALPLPVANARVLVPLSLVALYIIWGSTYLGIRFALESYPPFLLAGIRYLCAGVLLFVYLCLRRVSLPAPRQWLNAAVTGVLLLGFGNGLVCVAEQHVSSGISAVTFASVPLLTAMFSGLYGAWPNRRENVGLLIGFAGVIVLNLGSNLSGSRWGALTLLVAACAWAFGSVWSKYQDMPDGPMNTTAQMLCAGLALLVFGVASGEHLPAHPTARASLAMVYLVVFGSLIAFSAYLYVLKHTHPVLATSYAYVNPAVAVLLGVLLADEHVGLFDLAGMMIVLLGVAVISLAKQRREDNA